VIIIQDAAYCTALQKLSTTAPASPASDEPVATAAIGAMLAADFVLCTCRASRTSRSRALKPLIFDRIFFFGQIKRVRSL